MKTIVITVFTTLSAVVFTISLLFNSMLSAFGLAAVSIDKLQALELSQQIVHSMKKRHGQKKLKLTKKLAKRSSKRIASTTMAAATVGTAGVVITMTSLEIADYCEDQRDLQADEDILFGTTTAFNVDQCVESAKADTLEIVDQLKSTSLKAIDDAWLDIAEYSNEQWEVLQQASDSAIDSTDATAREIWALGKSLFSK